VFLPILVAASAVTPGPAPPPEAARLAAALGPVRGKVGSWAEYLIRSRGEQDVRVRLSLVPPALEEDRSWLEVTVVGERTLPFAARLLVGSKGALERAVVYALGQAPIDLPVGEPRDEAPKSGRHPQVRRIGHCTVAVPAGTFAVEEMRVGATRVWRASRVPLWGLVRAQRPRQTVELTAYGFHGARSVFPDVQGKGSESTK
jgi:hypothetical protein